MNSVIFLVFLCVSAIFAQRSPYAGSRPSGVYNQPINNRVNLDTDGPEVIPIDYRNDLGYYNYLQSLPNYQHPFNLLNHQYIEAHRQQPNVQFSPYAPVSHHAGRR
jgi:hypothetical protein